jgi:hypothetical protein
MGYAIVKNGIYAGAYSDSNNPPRPLLDGETVVESEWDSDLNQPIGVTMPPSPAVTEVTRYQIRTWLVLNYGPTILTQIDGMLAAITDETQRVLAQIAWESATVIRLADPLTLQFGAALGLSESQMAEAFEVASQIGV